MGGIYNYTKAADLIHELGICGCGCPEEAYKAVHEMLVRTKDRGNIIEPDEPHVLFMAYTLDSLEFLEHGTSIYSAWLTDKGKELLAALDIFKEKYEYDWQAASNDIPNEFWVLEEKNREG